MLTIDTLDLWYFACFSVFSGSLLHNPRYPRKPRLNDWRASNGTTN